MHCRRSSPPSPSIFGIQTSSSIRSKRCARSRAMASAPSFATRTVNPFLASTDRTTCRVVRSSSTTSTLAAFLTGDATGGPLSFDDRLLLRTRQRLRQRGHLALEVRQGRIDARSLVLPRGLLETAGGVKCARRVQRAERAFERVRRPADRLEVGAPRGPADRGHHAGRLRPENRNRLPKQLAVAAEARLRVFQVERGARW